MAHRTPNQYPVGIQTFEEIRAARYLYVDKTALVWKLATESGKSFFLSRPRRFGKSLLLSTMQAYFEGRRELFEGLAIDKMETAWQRHPVIRLDMSTVKGGDYATIMATIDRMLRGLEARFGSDDRDATPGSRLQTLIDRAVAQTGEQAVVLVDEYDAPMLEVVDKPDELRRVCETMRELYIPLKARDADLRFVFLTGITKFSQLSIFSELNNLRNISMLADYAAICGITDDELHQQMAPDVNALAERLGITPSEAFSQLKAQFDGYHFCAESPDIYNPFSLLTALANGKIDSWWFGNGSPAGLLRLITGRNLDVADLTGVRAAERAGHRHARHLSRHDIRDGIQVQ